jgi:hypothetical protein
MTREKLHLIEERKLWLNARHFVNFISEWRPMAVTVNETMPRLSRWPASYPSVRKEGVWRGKVELAEA